MIVDNSVYSSQSAMYYNFSGHIYQIPVLLVDSPNFERMLQGVLLSTLSTI